MKLILLGAPGSGKGTISEQLEKDFNVYHLSAGALLREEISKNTTIGKDIQKYVASGELVPDSFVVQLVKLDAKNKPNYILDGFPRTLEQAQEIADLNIDAVILLDVPEDIVIQRFAGRRVCQTGEHGYHIQYLPPKTPGICDVDKTPLTQRKDDNPDIIKKRFQIYHAETSPLVSYYKQKNLLHKVNAQGSPQEVYQNVKKLIQQLKLSQN